MRPAVTGEVPSLRKTIRLRLREARRCASPSQAWSRLLLLLQFRELGLEDYLRVGGRSETALLRFVAEHAQELILDGDEGMARGAAQEFQQAVEILLGHPRAVELHVALLGLGEREGRACGGRGPLERPQHGG